MYFVLFIHQDSSETGATLKNIIDQNFDGIELETLRTVNQFEAKLRQFSNCYDRELLIILVDSKHRLNELIPLIQLLEDKRLILILPDQSNDVLSVAHRFYPRFFTYINDTYDDLCSVLDKMIQPKPMNKN